MIDIGKDNNKKISFDLATLVDTRLLVQSNSGGGKSYALRRILEQSHGHIQQIVLDLEGEFATLREKFDYIIAGKDGDIVANPATAKQLALHLLKHRVSAICDLYELKAHDRVRFIRLFLESLMSAPRSLWQPVLVIVDEAHHFCPEKGQAESHQAIIDLCTRGRKRGYCGILATQRLSKLHKDACAELLNKMIGRTSLDIDQSRAADELGIIGKQDRIALRNLKPGEFHAYGPALLIDGTHSNDVIRTKVGKVRSTHPKIGARRIEAPPPPSVKIRRILKKLSDLPAEAEKEAQDLGSLKKQNAELRRKLTIAEKGHDAVKPCNHESVIKQLEGQIEEYKVLGESLLKSFGTISNHVKNIGGELDREFRDLTRQYETIVKHRIVVKPNKSSDKKTSRPIIPTKSDPITPVNGDISRAQQKILNALAALEAIGLDKAHKNVVAVFSGASPRSGGYFNNLGRLRSNGFINYPTASYVSLTDGGRDLADNHEPISSVNQLHDAWCNIVSGSQAKILRALIEIYPEDLSKDELANQIGVSQRSGGYYNNLGRLRTLGAIAYPEPGRVAATELLFPEGLA